MTDAEKPKVQEADAVAAAGPLVFISHDSRDADLAEAFAKLLKSVSAGMLKTFWSSDKKGKEGFEFGAEWYADLMSKLQATSHVVCLFTERSIERPWILFEAGVAKGKLNTPVIGVALGVPLKRVGTGPFYQFQNMDDSEGQLEKLARQLAKGVSGLEIDADVLKAQIAAFKTAEKALLDGRGGERGGQSSEADDSPMARLVEEMKALPSRVAERLGDGGDPFRRRRMRRFHPMMFEELMGMSEKPGDPVGILMAASLVRDEIPWLYELAMEVYRAVKTGDRGAIEQEVRRLRSFSELTLRGPFMEEFVGGSGREAFMFARELPRMLEHQLRRTLEAAPPPEPEPKKALPKRSRRKSG